MKRFVLAGVGRARRSDTDGAASAADLSRRQAMPTKAPMYAAPYNWTGFYVGINGGGGWGRSRFRRAFPPAASTPRAAWSAAPSATTGRWARRCSASKATSTGATSSGSAACGAAPPAKPATTGSAPRAAASVTRSTASCLTSPAASRSATSRPPSPASAASTHQRRLDRSAAASRPRSPAPGPPRSNISTSISADGGSVLGYRLRISQQSRARRPELSLLIAATLAATKPGTKVPGFLRPLGQNCPGTVSAQTLSGQSGTAHSRPSTEFGQ